MVGGGIDILICEVENEEEWFCSIVGVEVEKMIGVITLKSGMSVLMIEGDETCLGKTDDGTINGGNGRGTLKE